MTISETWAGHTHASLRGKWFENPEVPPGIETGALEFKVGTLKNTPQTSFPK